MNAEEPALLLFDWNGTIVMDADRARTALNGVLADHELTPLDPQGFADRFRLPMRAMFGELGIRVSERSRAERDWNHAMTSGTPVARVGTQEALASFRRDGVRLGVVSAASRPALRHDMDALGLTELWDVVEGGVSAKDRALRALRAGAVHAMYVGDTVYDIECALGAGYRAVGVEDGYTSADRLIAAGAEAVISDLRQLGELLTASRARREIASGDPDF